MVLNLQLEICRATRSSEEFVTRHVGGFIRHGLLVDTFHLLMRVTANAQNEYFEGNFICMVVRFISVDFFQFGSEEMSL